MTKCDKKWHLQYEKLIKLKRKNGHCIVPIKYKEDKVFGRRISRQRTSHTNKKMHRDRKELLDDIGFVWKIPEDADKRWHQQYEKLVEFKRKNGHCIVPFRYEQDKPLGQWVSKQRASHAHKTI